MTDTHDATDQARAGEPPKHLRGIRVMHELGKQNTMRGTLEAIGELDTALAAARAEVERQSRQIEALRWMLSLEKGNCDVIDVPAWAFNAAFAVRRDGKESEEGRS